LTAWAIDCAAKFSFIRLVDYHWCFVLLGVVFPGFLSFDLVGAVEFFSTWDDGYRRGPSKVYVR